MACHFLSSSASKQNSSLSLKSPCLMFSPLSKNFRDPLIMPLAVCAIGVVPLLLFATETQLFPVGGNSRE